MVEKRKITKNHKSEMSISSEFFDLESPCRLKKGAHKMNGHFNRKMILHSNGRLHFAGGVIRSSADDTHWKLSAKGS